MFQAFNKPFLVILASLQDWWRAWVDMAVLNLGWVVCCATVLLGPPATLALYGIAQHVYEGQSVDYRNLSRTVRRTFLVSWVWFMLNACFAAGVWLNLIYYSRIIYPWNILLLVIVLFVSAMWLMVQFYALPFMMVQPNPDLLRAFRNGLFTLLASPWYSTVVFFFILILILLTRWLPFLLFLGTPLLIAMLGSHAVNERLAHFQVKEQQNVNVS